MIPVYFQEMGVARFLLTEHGVPHIRGPKSSVETPLHRVGVMAMRQCTAVRWQCGNCGHGLVGSLRRCFSLRAHKLLWCFLLETCESSGLF